MTETQVLVINADRPDIDQPLAMGPEPEMFKLTQHNYKSGEWPFPVRLVKPGTKPWDDETYLASMKPDPLATEQEQAKLIKQAYGKDCHTMQKLSEATGVNRERVRFLVHKCGLRIGNDYWRAEKYNDPSDVVTGANAIDLASKIYAPPESIRQANDSGGIVLGYRIRRVPRI